MALTLPEEFARLQARSLVSPVGPPTAPTSGGVKHDSGKPPLGLLPWRALVEVAKVLDHGAKKYSKHNWRGGFAYSRLYDAALRHLTAFIEGQDNDEETGLSHLAHLSCCTLFLLTQVLEQMPGLDDRFKPVDPPPANPVPQKNLSDLSMKWDQT